MAILAHWRTHQWLKRCCSCEESRDAASQDSTSYAVLTCSARIGTSQLRLDYSRHGNIGMH